MIIAVLVSILVCLQAPAAEQNMGARDVNVVKSIRARGPAIEIELHSSREFPVGGQVLVLTVGKKEFAKSRHPADGSLNTLIFTLDADEFEQLPDGETMTVGIGRRKGGDDATARTPVPARSSGPETGRRWKFGTLDKSLLYR